MITEVCGIINATMYSIEYTKHYSRNFHDAFIYFPICIAT